jgi:undecaprenyl-diphosphatase
MSEVCTAGVDTGFVALGPAKSAFLGVIQGITELMPISSTAHMRVVPALLGWQDPGSAYSAAMQLAALAAVMTYFWRDVAGIGGGAVGALTKGRFGDHNLRLCIWIAIATLPIILAGLLLSKTLNTCNSPLRGIAVVGWACVGMAILLALAEILARHRRRMENASFIDALAVGIAQAGALIPGVSRSGSTLTAALGLGFKREDAARFSFLLGIPAIAGAGLVEILKLHKAHLSAYGWEVLIVGLAVASVASFVAIWALMRILERFSAWPFVVYRAILGVVLLVGGAKGWIR